MTSKTSSRSKKSSRFVISDDESFEQIPSGEQVTVPSVVGAALVNTKLDMEPVREKVAGKKGFKTDQNREFGDFKAVLSKADKRKQAQLAKAAEERRKKEEEKRAAAAAKNAALEEAARKEAEAKEALCLAQKAAEDQKRKEEKDKRKKEAKESKKLAAKAKRESKKVNEEPIPAPPPAVPTAPPSISLFESSPRPQPPRTTFPISPSSHQPNPAILRDPAVASIGSVISEPSLPSRLTIGTQTDPVRVLPIEDNHYASLSSTSAAWWLSQQQMPQAAYMEAMQRMSVPPPGPPHWQQPGVSSMADLYWQQQQPPHRYHRL
jgi:hypothetical protein